MGNNLNEWLVATYRAFVRADSSRIDSILGLDTMLRNEDCEQGSLRCNGRTYKLCVRRDTVGGTREPTAPVQSKTIYALVLILRLICLLFFFFFFISLIADGPHHYHPACGHKESSHFSRFTPYIFFIAMQVQHSYNSSTNG